jgi:hypothetical protein
MSEILFKISSLVAIVGLFLMMVSMAFDLFKS